LRGENFNNESALGAAIGSGNIGDINISEADYVRLAQMGANHVRFGLGFSWYAADRARFFQVVDRHVAWAGAHHLWFIPVMFTTPADCYEGYGVTCSLWTDAAQQRALQNFWVDFAAYYTRNPTVAGYDLLNEPTPPGPGYVDGNWWPLAQRIRDAVVAVDPNHFVIIEAGSDSQFYRLLGPRVVYSVHDYAPLSMTHSQCCAYPGPAPDWDGSVVNWNHDSIGAMMWDRLSIRWANANGVPLWVGEWGTKRGYPGYDRLLADRVDLLNNLWHVHWAHFLWRSGPADFGMYECLGFGCPDAPEINAVAPGFAGSVRP